jgi:hypothetical protein
VELVKHVDMNAIVVIVVLVVVENVIAIAVNIKKK